MNIRHAYPKGNPRIFTCSRCNKYGVFHCFQHRVPHDSLYGILLRERRVPPPSREERGAPPPKRPEEDRQRQRIRLIVVDEQTKNSELRQSLTILWSDGRCTVCSSIL